MIKVEHLSVVLNEHNILDDISFEIKKGETVAIIGPNGSGKSTLLKTILGFIRYDGQIALFGKNQISWNAYKYFEKDIFKKIGYVPQKIEFDRTVPITVMELFMIYSKKKKKKAVLALLSEVGVQHLADAGLGHLSGGEFQRVMIALALVNDPELLILDEATAGVDVEGETVIYDILENLRRQHGLTVIFVSHDISLVYKYASQVICLNHQLLCHGTPAVALTKEIIESLYAQKIVPYEHHEEPSHNHTDEHRH